MADLPEEFAPTGPKLSRFPIRPAPPVRPRLFADEGRFALRLALLCGGTELAAWAWIARSSQGVLLPALLLGSLRLLRPLWAAAGTRAPRPAIAFALLAVALALQGAAALSWSWTWWAAAAIACGLPSLGDLAATHIVDSVTVERRAAALSWLEMGQGAGVALGLSLGVLSPRMLSVPLWAAAALLLAGVGVGDLRDRGTPRSAWPREVYFDALRAPLCRTLVPLALGIGALAGAALRRSPGVAGWAAALAPLAGMVLAARLEPHARNAAGVPRALLALAAVAVLLSFYDSRFAGPCALAALGGCASALPASVARGAAEMERAPSSTWVWSALLLGTLFGLVLGTLRGSL